MNKLERHNALINSLCERYKIDLWDFKQNNDAFKWVCLKKHLINYACIWTDVRILHLGKFSSLDTRLIVFLHELGHLLLVMKDPTNAPTDLSSPTDIYRVEIQAWRIAFKLLRKKGALPTKKMVYHCHISISTYKQNLTGVC